MRNLRKVVALVLAFAMVLSMSSVSFAADMTAADKATTLGILVGSGDGVTAEYLMETPTRAQAAVISLRLQGLDEVALAYEGTMTFDDADELAWGDVGANMLSYLKENPEAGWVGTADGMFEPNAPIEAQAYLKVMLEALGYEYDVDFTWGEVFTFAADLGLTGLTADTVMTNDSLAVGAVEALAATNADGEVLAAALVAAGALDEAAAVEVGLVEAAPEALAVESVVMNNLKEVVVTFNMELEAAKAVAGNFAVTGNTVTAISADGMSYTLSLEAAEGQQDNVEVIAKTGTGLAAEYKTTLTGVTDFTVPVLESVALTGPKTFELTFSEPINVKPSVLVNSGVYGAAVDAPVGNKVTVNLAVALEDGTYDISVSGAKDFAGWTMAATEEILAYVKDASNLTVSVVEAAQTYVIVEFNKVPAATPAGADFYHTYSAWAATTVTAVAGSTTQFKVWFPATHYVVPGTTNLVVSDDNIADQWGNKLAADAVLPITVAIDMTAPMVASVTVKAENKIEVVFDEDVSGADTAANYVIKDADAKDVTNISGIVYASKKATITLGAKLSGGNYTLTVKNVTDATPQANKMAEHSEAIAITDMTAPVQLKAEYVASATANDIVYVTWNEAMGSAAIDTAQWVFTNNTLYATPTKAEFFNGDAKKVKLTFDKFSDGTTVVDLAAGGFVLAYGKVDDAAGNVVAGLSTPTSTYGALGVGEFTAKTLASNKLELTFDGKVTTGQNVATNFFVTAASGTGSAAIASYTENDKGNTVVTLVMPSGLTFGGAETTASVTAAGLKMDTGIGVQTGAEVATDGIAPTLKAIASTAGAVTLDFSEVVTTGTNNEAFAAFDLVVTVDGTTLTAGADYTTTIVGGDVVVAIAPAKAPTAGEKLTIDTVAAPAWITDASSNKLAENGTALSDTY